MDDKAIKEVIETLPRVNVLVGLVSGDAKDEEKMKEARASLYKYWYENVRKNGAKDV